MPILTTSMGVTENTIVGARTKHTPDNEYPLPSQRGPVSVGKESQSPTEHRIVSPVGTGHILGEGAAIFTDMTETMLTTLGQKMALSDEAQKPNGSLMNKLLTSDKCLVMVTLDQKNLKL